MSTIVVSVVEYTWVLVVVLDSTTTNSKLALQSTFIQDSTPLRARTSPTIPSYLFCRNILLRPWSPPCFPSVEPSCYHVGPPPTAAELGPHATRSGGALPRSPSWVIAEARRFNGRSDSTTTTTTRNFTQLWGKKKFTQRWYTRR